MVACFTQNAMMAGHTLVLSLLGTQGVEEPWSDRRASVGHLGIPLLSSAFVEEIPMISRLLEELGVPLSWIDSQDADLVQRSLGRAAGLFYVENASEAVDARGRHIISAQDFVATYGIRTVFGVGGAYFDGAVLALVVFCHDRVDRSAASHLMSLTSFFRSRTTQLVADGHVLSPDV